MRPVEISEIKSIAEYELERLKWRPQVMALKDRRRIRVGDHLTFLFENHETVRFQLQEMIRIERMVRPEEIAHELETYNRLVPGFGELSASLLIEYETPELRALWLHDLLGLERHIWLVVADTPRVPCLLNVRQISTDRINPVQHLKFALSVEQIYQLRRGAKLVVDHPRYSAEQVLSAELLQELSQDLAS